MALKAIMLRAKLDKKNKELDALREKDADFTKRESELEAAIAEAQTEEEQQTVSDAVDQFEKEKRRMKRQRQVCRMKLAIWSQNWKKQKRNRKKQNREQLGKMEKQKGWKE